MKNKDRCNKFKSIVNAVLSIRRYDKMIARSITYNIKGFGGIEVACWPLVSKFAGSNPAEAVGFLRAKKSSARLPSEGK
jgi:hypothetical protein